MRSLPLGSLQYQAAQAILKAKGICASEHDLRLLVEHCAGNPLALKIVATTVQDIFKGNVPELLTQETAIFGDIRNLLEQQFNRLSDLEKEVAYWLAINRKPISLSELREDMVCPVPQLRLLETIEFLSRRSLIERSITLSESLEKPKAFAKKDCSFTLQPVVTEYVTKRLIEQVCVEIVTHQIVLFNQYALLKATAQDYVKETQIRLILKPVIDRLKAILGSFQRIKIQLTQVLAKRQEASALEPGYTGAMFSICFVN